MRIKPKSEQEHNSINEDLHRRASSGEKLSTIEIDYFCNCLRRDLRLNFSICDEYRFRDYYFRSLDNNVGSQFPMLTDEELKELDLFADGWYNKIVQIPNHSSQTLQHIAKEARKEIKLISKEFSYNGYLVRSNLYQQKLKKIMWMSRFIHFKIVYDYFIGYQKTEIVIPSKFGEVIFNDVSLAHIYTRHYAAGEKQYLTEQSFFSPDIHFNSIHRVIILVLGWITKNNIQILKPISKAITFKFKEHYYQLYLDNTFVQRKGQKGNISILRVKSLFPVNDKIILSKISHLNGHQVSKDLIIYEQ